MPIFYFFDLFFSSEDMETKTEAASNGGEEGGAGDAKPTEEPENTKAEGNEGFLIAKIKLDYRKLSDFNYLLM